MLISAASEGVFICFLYCKIRESASDIKVFYEGLCQMIVELYEMFFWTDEVGCPSIACFRGKRERLR